LLPELQAQGYRGSARTLRRYLTARRRGAPPRTKPAPISARRVVGLILGRPETLDVKHQQLLERVCEQCAELAVACQLARTFAAILRERRGADAFEAWATDAERSSVSELRGFATNLRRDRAAVVAGLTLPWSSGSVEGNVTRVKLIKRTMYGRSRFDLLRRRVLLAS
jgi:transposase